MKQRKSLSKIALPRIYFIDKEIASGKYPNVPELAKKYETSASSINRDIAYMRDMMNAPIAYDFFEKGFYYTEKTFRLAAAYATADDLLALGMAKNLMELYRNTSLHETTLKLLENISIPLKGDKSADDWFSNRIVIPKIASAKVDIKIWKTVVCGLRDNKVLTFSYLCADLEGLSDKGESSGKKVNFRRVHPYQLLFDQSTWYLYAYDENRSAMRTFSLTRILDIAVTGENFKIRDDFDYRSLEGASYFGIYAQENKACKFVIAVTGDTRWIRERQWAEDQHIKEIRGGIEISFTSNQFEKVLQWILAQGARAKPLAPKSLVKLWGETIQAMSKLMR
ncbi:MAG: WYL domain-containing protein [Spirochaetaceae bacterium]|nr:WYL domain-containing protein [Spirochaetaceae bacterium]